MTLMRSDCHSAAAFADESTGPVLLLCWARWGVKARRMSSAASERRYAVAALVYARERSAGWAESLFEDSHDLMLLLENQSINRV